MSTRYYWDDLPPGHKTQLGRYTLSLDEVIGFARQYDPLPFHTDPVAALDTPIGVHCASGIQTMAILQRLTVESWFAHMHLVAGMGVDKVRFHTPVLPGDTLTGELEVIEQRQLPRQTERGAIVYKAALYNAQRQKVASMEGCVMLMRRTASSTDTGSTP